MYELTEADLQDDPFNIIYNMEVPLVGRLSGGSSDGIEINMAASSSEIVSNFEPNTYFMLYDSDNNGLMMRPRIGIDRDVSFC